ncbi:MAG TPA: M50 family metallopeptidase [Patescibacteria group bacterium]|nr:M50 family metallopeptidase [Patescibacteria group bacterium]
MAILVFIIILSVLVMLHELGHFLMAKRAGIGVEEFGIGLPPRIWGKKIGETIYSVNWLPFGGFVRLVGEDPEDKKKNQKNSFYTKSIGQRMLVVVAGVVANFALAVVIFYIVVAALGYKVSLPLLIDHNFKFVNQTKQVLIADVSADSPAASAGIQIGDSIVSAKGQEISSIEKLQEVIRSSENEQIPLILENPVNNQKRVVTVTPKYSQEQQAPVLGVGLGELVVLNYQTWPQKAFSGFIHSYNTLDYSVRVFSEIIGYSIRSRDITPVSEGVAGPVGIAAITSQAVSLGWLSVMQLVGLLSLNLAVINILPIPALDGGRFAFIIVEAIIKRRVYPKVEKWAHTIGFALLLALILLVTYNDILKLVR